MTVQISHRYFTLLLQAHEGYNLVAKTITSLASLQTDSWSPLMLPITECIAQIHCTGQSNHFQFLISLVSTHDPVHSRALTLLQHQSSDKHKHASAAGRECHSAVASA